MDKTTNTCGIVDPLTFRPKQIVGSTEKGYPASHVLIHVRRSWPECFLFLAKMCVCVCSFFSRIIELLSTLKNRRVTSLMVFPGLTLQYLTTGQQDHPYVRRNVAWDHSVNMWNVARVSGFSMLSVFSAPWFSSNLTFTIYIPKQFPTPSLRFPAFRLRFGSVVVGCWGLAAARWGSRGPGLLRPGLLRSAGAHGLCRREARGHWLLRLLAGRGGGQRPGMLR